MIYEAKRNQLVWMYTEGQLLENNESENGQFELVSAGFANYLPALPIEQHHLLYRQLLLHQQLSVLEQSEPAVLEYVCCEGEAEEALDYMQHKPVIVCTMHSGSYRIINLLLLQKGIPYSLVIGKTVLAKEGQTFQHLHRSISNGQCRPLELIDAEQSSAGLQMLRALKKGRSLVLYMDGNSGAGTTTTYNVNNCVVDFLAQQLYVRKGIAYLAHAAGIPIVPVMCYRKRIEEIRLRFFSMMLPDATISRDLYAASATQELYHKFGKLIKEMPEQWEGWLTIHQTAKISYSTTDYHLQTGKKSEKVVLNTFRFGIFKTGGLAFLLEKQKYLFYPLDETLFRLLTECKHAPVACKRINQDLFQLLLGRGIVKYV